MRGDCRLRDSGVDGEGIRRQVVGVTGNFEIRAFLRDFGRLAQSKGFEMRELWDSEAGPMVVWEKDVGGALRYLSAGMHGDEPAGPWAMRELLRGGDLDEGSWCLCPILNPTGLARGTRENVEGVDLNRDYLLRKSGEVQAHAAWLERLECPKLFLSLHEDWESSGFYFYEINQGDERPERARGILREVGKVMLIEPQMRIDDHEVREEGWIYHQAEADFPEEWPEAIFVAKLGCPLSYTFETPSSERLELRVEAHLAAVRAALREG